MLGFVNKDKRPPFAQLPCKSHGIRNFPFQIWCHKVVNIFLETMAV